MCQLDSDEPAESIFQLFDECRKPKACFLSSAEVCVLWASTVASKHGFKRHELLCIARGFARSEFSGSSVQIVIVSPFCLCRIYSNGRVTIMGNLTESQALMQLQRVVYKLRYRLKWKVLTSTDNLRHGNGLEWRYMVDSNVVKVKAAINNFKVDQLYYKLAFSQPFEIAALFRKCLKEKRKVTLINNKCLRLYVDLPMPEEEEIQTSECYGAAPAWEVGLELERELEAELARMEHRNTRYATCIIYSSGKVAILGCKNSNQARDTYEALIGVL